MGLGAAIETLSALPPNQIEVLALSVKAARSFLAESREYVPISDVEGGKEDENWGTNGKARHAIRWQDEDSAIVEAKDVKPGDTIVVPTSYGGLDKFGWNPDSTIPTVDVGDEAASQKRGRAVIRMHESLIPQWFAADQSDSIAEAQSILRGVLTRYDEGEDMADLCDDLIEGLLSLPVKEDIREKFEIMQSNRTGTPYPGGLLLQQALVKEASAVDHEVLLETHSRDVAELTSKFVCGIPQAISVDVVEAAKLHDLGKADQRFEKSLWDGLRRSDRVLAKSTQKMDLPSIRRARQLAGYPKGTRHECYSVAMAGGSSDLVKYLIGVHHGRGRALMPSIDDPGTTIKFNSCEFSGRHCLDRLGGGWTDLFWRLNRRYGYWGLAYLESMVRLADHTMSAQEDSSDE
jgi:CRISPR-associated endonuclease/helicase Cas3